MKYLHRDSEQLSIDTSIMLRDANKSVFDRGLLVQITVLEMDGHWKAADWEVP